MADDSERTGSGHPITAAVARLRSVVASVAEQPTWSLTDTETRQALVELAGLTAQVVDLESRLITRADTVDKGALSTPTWLARATRITSTQAQTKVHLAAALAAHQQTRDGMAATAGWPDGRPARHR